MLLQALTEFYERATREGLIDEQAFYPKRVRWIIPLDADGNLEGVGLIDTTDEKKRPREFKRAPRATRPKKGKVADFLAEEMGAVFGLQKDLSDKNESERTLARQSENLQAKYGDFWRQVREGYEITGDPMFAALLSFTANHVVPSESFSMRVPSFLRWGTVENAKAGEKSGWLVKTSSGEETKIGGDNFTFSVTGKVLIEDDAVQDYWHNAFTAEVSATESASVIGLCLVTGKIGVPIMASHIPKIAGGGKGVPGASSMGTALVSFDKEAFKSYGFDQSYNAPVSSAAVRAYVDALNWLLRERDHTLKIGNTALCFWARESDAVTGRISLLLDRPDPKAVRAFLTSPFAGDGDRAPVTQDRFYSVTLGGNAGRVVVRHWMQMTVKEAVENFKQWFADLNIVTFGRISDDDSSSPLSLYRLAMTTIDTKEKEKKFDSELLSQLYRAALEQSAPSLLLAKKILDRFAVDLTRDGEKALNLSRFALLRLIVNRNRKKGETMIEPKITDTEDAAYNCGRLLAVFDDLQREALSTEENRFDGAGVVERYYGSASSAPNSAFGILWRLHQHHLKKLSRMGDKKRAKAQAVKRKIEEIACRFKQPDPRLPPEFPRTFDLRAQGRFALGFYQQKAAERHARTAYLETKRAADDAAPQNAGAQNTALDPMNAQTTPEGDQENG